MVKCVECGYLATRNIKSRQLEEMEAEYRKIGMNPNELGSLYGAPICFAQAYDLKSEQWKVWQSRNTPGMAIPKHSRYSYRSRPGHNTSRYN
jgi:hypothetical protein